MGCRIFMLDMRICIETLELLGGSLPARALTLVRQWATLHREELAKNWQRARNEETLKAIPPLP
jgi:hypothetical protein